MWDRGFNRGAASATLSALALFVACSAQETDFADDVASSGGSGGSGNDSSAGSAGVSSTSGRGGSSSDGGASARGGSDSGGDAGSRATGGDAGSGAGGEAGARGGVGGAMSGGGAGDGGGDAGGHGGAGGDGRGGDPGEGSGGEGGSDTGFACETSVGTPAQPVVSDLESGELSALAPYAGTWEPFFSGGNAVLGVVSEGADATDHALRLSGSNSTFAGLAIGLNDDGEHVCPHSGADFDGIRFFYKSTHPLTAQLASRATVPPPDGSCAGICYNYHQKTLPPTQHFREVVLRYSELEQTSGTVAPIARDELLSIRFVLSGVVNVSGAVPITGSFEADVDELEFFAD